MIDTLEHLSCLICLGIAEEAVHCSKCFALMCDDCSKPISPRICPSCRQNLSCEQSKLARKIISKLETGCNLCYETYTYGTIKQHFPLCPERVIYCNVGKCNFSGKKNDFIMHLTIKHIDNVLTSFEKKISSNFNGTNQLQEYENNEPFFGDLFGE